jgi:hypothetical protein
MFFKCSGFGVAEPSSRALKTERGLASSADQNITRKTKMKSLHIREILAAFVFIASFLHVDAKAVNPNAEARFIAQAKAAFDTKDSSKLLALVCWDDVQPEVKQSVSQQFANLVTLTPANIELVVPDPKQKFEYSRGGVTYRTNLAVTKLLKIQFTPGNPLNTTEASIPVGVKDGKLFITTTVLSK